MDIEGGRNLLQLLDSSDLSVDSAFWYYLTDIDEWRLFFAIRELNDVGPRFIYEKIREVLEDNSETIHFSLNRISIINPADQLNSLLKMAITTGPGISGIRFSGNVINGVLFKDTYIYRVT